MGASKDAEDGLLTPRKIAQRLRTTGEELARSAGLGRGAIRKKDRIASGETRGRLRELAEVINKVEPRLGSALTAYAWYRSQPLPDFRARRRCSSCEAAGLAMCSIMSMPSMLACMLEQGRGANSFPSS